MEAVRQKAKAGNASCALRTALALTFVLGVCALVAPARAEAAWVYNNNRWQWTESDGSIAVNRWHYIEGSWYHFDANGNMEVGWSFIDGAWYYFKPGGQMTTGFATIDGFRYYFGDPGTSGVMTIGWRWIVDAWYYFRADGTMCVGPTEVDGVNYLFAEDGRMNNGMSEYGGVTYLHNGDGSPVVGWVKDGGSWYLYDSWGAQQRGWCWWGSWYYFNSDGAMARICWVDDCYLDENGHMVTSAWVGDRYVGSNGYWQRDAVRTDSDVDLPEPTNAGGMWGVDVSSHDHANAIEGHFRTNTENAYLQTDFVIVKATQGGGYYNPFYEADMARAISDHKLLGVYHYAGNQEPEEEADMFYEQFKPYVGLAVPVLDWEMYQNENNFGKRDDWCRRFVDRFFDRSGVWCMIYTSASVVMGGQVDNTASTCPLWVAGYPDNRNSFSLPEFMWSVSPWNAYSIWQFSSSNGVTDRNYSPLDRVAWELMCEVSSKAGRWIAVGNDYWYCHHTTLDYTANDWELIDGKWYHFNENGWMDRQWLCLEGDWYWLGWDGSRRENTWETILGKDYHFGSDGKMDHDTIVDGRVLGPDGAAHGRVVVDDEEQGTPVETQSVQLASAASGAEAQERHGLSVANVNHAPGWAIERGSWHYYDAWGNLVVNRWEFIEGFWYYFNEMGDMCRGFFDTADGKLYHADMSGALHTGWQFINGNWYFADASGAIKRGWMCKDGVWYYFDHPGGEMANDWRQVSNDWYLFEPSGSMITGWHHNGHGWFHFSDNGSMDTGWCYIDDNWYHFNENGYMTTGWLLLDDAWYYLYPDGSMAHNTVVDGVYYMGTNGKWLEDKTAYINEWATRINDYLEDSEMEGLGLPFASAAYDYDVDPRWSPAIAYVESGLGNICAYSHNAWGWGSSEWDSWSEAIFDHIEGLSELYGKTLTHEAASMYVYGNTSIPANHWYDAVLEQMNEI